MLGGHVAMDAGPREDDAPLGGSPAPLPDDPGQLGLAAREPTLVTGDEPEGPPGPEAESYAELRPQPRLRLTQFAPIVVLSLLGSLMFAFPLAFAFDDAGAVVAMLGLLIGSSAAGWGLIAARRAGYTWPGLPPRGSGRRPDWRMLLLYGVVLALCCVFAVWRVSGLR